jgi:hypothetical protein
MTPKKPKKTTKTGAPAKGYKWAETTSGRIPDPVIVPVKKMPKFKPMRTVASGTSPSGKARMTVKKGRSL